MSDNIDPELMPDMTPPRKLKTRQVGTTLLASQMSKIARRRDIEQSDREYIAKRQKSRDEKNSRKA